MMARSQHKIMIEPWKSVAYFVLRAIVLTHFIYELIDKCVRFDHWEGIILAQSGLGTWSLVLVIALLTVGIVLILFNKFLLVAALSLAVFQIPTSILFEQSGYEQADSTSALGGVFALVFISALEERQNDLNTLEGGHLHENLLYRHHQDE